MRLGSEFSFHPSIDRLAARKEAVVSAFFYQLRHGGTWETLVTVTPTVADRITSNQAARGSQPGKSWRLWPVDKPFPKPRARKAAKGAETPVGATEDKGA